MSKHPDIPVVCTLCGTRMHAYVSQIGKGIKCPDCYTVTIVKEPERKPTRRPTQNRSDDDIEYRLADEGLETIVLTCTTCHEAMRTKLEYAGRRVKCPQCGASNEVPRTTAMQAAGDVSANRPLTQKDIADRLMEKARQEISEVEEVNDIEVPVKPFTDGVFNFPLQGIILLHWIAFSLSLAVAGMLLDITIRKLSEHTFEMGVGLFTGLAFCAVFTFIIAFFPIKLMDILQITSSGHREFEFSQSDFFDRVYTIFIFSVGIVIGSAPGVLLASLFQVPRLWPAVLSLTIFFPIALLSILETGEPWKFFSDRIRNSLTNAGGSWLVFYIFSAILVLGFFCLTAAVFDAESTAIAIVVISVGLPYVLLVYFRLLGRLGLMINETETELFRSKQLNV